MNRKIGFCGLTAALLLLSPYSVHAQAAPQGPRAALVLVSDARFDAGTYGSLLSIAGSKLAADGVPVLEEPSLHAPRVLDDALAGELHALGVSRVFILHLGHLGRKILFQLDERDATFDQLISTAALTGPIEEADQILPRLVDSIIHGQPVDATATVGNLTQDEARPYNVRPGIGHFVLGLPIGLTSAGANGTVGLSMGFLYETEKWGVGFNSQFALGGNASFLGDLDIFGDYFFSPGFVSPYIGLGLGYLGIIVPQNSSNSTIGSTDVAVSGAGVRPEVGIELFRLNHIRLRISLEALIPFSQPTNSGYIAGVLLHAQLAF